MSKFYKYGIVAFVVLMASMGAASTYALGAKKSSSTAGATSTVAPDAKKDDKTVVDTGWNVRCDDAKKPKTGDCQAFTRLEMKASNMRVSEVTVDYPQNDKTVPAGYARGVIILPLGILLDGVTMSIDDGKPFAFKPRFCIQAGCYSVVNLNKDILDSMAKGKLLNVFFKISDGHDAKLSLGLKGFDKALAKVQ